MSLGAFSQNDHITFKFDSSWILLSTNLLIDNVFFARKVTARGVNLNLRVDVICRFRMVKNKPRDDVESAHVHGAPLKRTAEE